MSVGRSPFAAATPLYRQVSERLFGEIVEGKWRPGEALPTESQLCEIHGVSRITIRKALDELVEHRIVHRRHGVGTFVSESGGSRWSANLTGVIEEILLPTDMTIVREAMVEPPADVLEFARLPAGTQLKLFEGTNHIDGVPLVHARYYFPPRIAEKLSVELLSGRSQAIRQVERMFDLRVNHAEQVISPLNATGPVAQHLQLEPGTAVLRAVRVYYDNQQQPVEIFDAAYHPVHYRYTAQLHPAPRRR